MNKLKITYKPANELIPYARNSRTHSDEQINQIASSIREFGFRQPVLIDGDNGIIAGHGRVLAAMRLNLEEIPTVDGSDLTENQKRLYVIADNKIALNAGWDEEILKVELESFTDAEQLITGFNAEELNLLFNGWHSDIDRMDNIDAKDTSAKEKIIIVCEENEKPLLREKITNLIDDLGLHNVEVN